MKKSSNKCVKFFYKKRVVENVISVPSDSKLPVITLPKTKLYNHKVLSFLLPRIWSTLHDRPDISFKLHVVQKNTASL